MTDTHKKSAFEEIERIGDIDNAAQNEVPPTRSGRDSD